MIIITETIITTVHSRSLQFKKNHNIIIIKKGNIQIKPIHPTYVNEVALAVQHDVAVMSVFDLQQEQQKAVSGHTADEVVTSLQKEHTCDNEV